MKGKKKETIIVAPSECHSASYFEIFDLPLLREKPASRGLAMWCRNVSSNQHGCPELTVKPPKNIEQTNKMFNYMAGNFLTLALEISRNFVIHCERQGSSNDSPDLIYENFSTSCPAAIAVRSG
ncbi:hypothetical protein V1522DRAFT_408217 [Lipomyces starkeyi]